MRSFSYIRLVLPFIICDIRCSCLLSRQSIDIVRQPLSVIKMLRISDRKIRPHSLIYRIKGSVLYRAQLVIRGDTEPRAVCGNTGLDYTCTSA